jgi:hypothetical protein
MLIPLNRQSEILMRAKIRIINGVLNYVIAIFLIASPWLFSIHETVVGRFVLLLSGMASIAIGLVADYELGILKSIKYKEFLIANIILGIFLVISPAIFAFGENVFLPHVLLGSLQMIIPYFAYKIHFAKRRTFLPQYH